MYPILFEWGTVVIPSWHAFYVLGAVFAYALLVHLGRTYAPEVDSRDVARLYIVCYLGGYFGARVLSVVIEEPDVQGIAATLAALKRFGAMTFYGGAVASFLLGLAYARWRRLPVGPLADIALPAGLVALVVGRIGCFLNGDDYGIATRGPFGIIVPSLKDDIPRHPVQLYEAASVALLTFVLLVAFGRLRTAFKPGIVGFFAIVGYANLRFGLEYLRGDFRGFAFGTWMSTSQFISVVVLAVCACMIPYWARR